MILHYYSQLAFWNAQSETYIFFQEIKAVDEDLNNESEDDENIFDSI